MLLGRLGSSRHLWVIAETLIGNGNNAHLYMFPTGVLSGLLALKSFHLHEVIPCQPLSACSFAQRSTTPASTTRPFAIEPLILDHPLCQSTYSSPKSTFCEPVAFSLFRNPSRAEKRGSPTAELCSRLQEWSATTIPTFKRKSGTEIKSNDD